MRPAQHTFTVCATVQSKKKQMKESGKEAQLANGEGATQEKFINPADAMLDEMHVRECY
jgi:hypothetical protein